MHEALVVKPFTDEKPVAAPSACAVFASSGTALPGEPCVQVAIASDVDSARVDEVRASEWGAALLELDSVHCSTDMLQTGGNLCY